MKKSVIRGALNASIGLVAAFALAGTSQRAQANNLFGIDVSHYQGSINWSSVHSCGANYAFAKATEGTTYTDPNFSSYMSNGKGAGMQMGAYHFAHPASNCANAEADHFWSVAGGKSSPMGNRCIRWLISRASAGPPVTRATPPGSTHGRAASNPRRLTSCTR